MAAMEGTGVKEKSGVVLSEWDPSGTLEWMDRNGIATVIASKPTPVYLDDRRYYPDLARRRNEYYARVIEEHPQQVRGSRHAAPAGCRCRAEGAGILP